MIIGVPREIKDQEYRVALLPSAAYQLIKRGHPVVVERGAGAGAGYADGDYEQAGAKLVDSHAAAFEQADLIVKVKEPQPAEYPLLRPGQLLFTYLHLAANKPLSEALAKSGVTGLGADVTILEVDVERMRFLDITLHTAHTLYSNEAHLMELLPSVDLLIGAVLVPGAKAPRLIRREMRRRMRPGSVLVDIAIDQGGCAETSRPTTHHDPVFVAEGVIHYCVANMPAAFARTATQALTNVTYRYIELLADHGLAEACQRHPALTGGINVMNGKVTCQAVGEAHGLPCSAPAFE